MSEISEINIINDESELKKYEDYIYKKWKIITLLILVLSYTGAQLTYNCLPLVIPMITNEYGYTNKQIGIVLSISTAARFIPKLFSGVIVDYFGGKIMMLIGLLGICIGGYIFPFSNSLWWWTLVWSFIRIFHCFPWLGIVKIASKWFKYDQMGMAMSILSLSFLFGSTLSLLYLDMFILLGFNYKELFFIGSSTLLIIIILSTFITKESPNKIGYKEPPPDPTNVFGLEDGDASKPENWKDIIIPIISTGPFWIMLIINMGLCLIRQVFLDWTPQYLSQQTGCSDVIANIGLVFFTFIGGISTLLLGYLHDKLPSLYRNCILCFLLCMLTISLFTTSLVNWYNTSIFSNIYVYMILICFVSFFLLGGLPSTSMSVQFGGKKICATISAFMDGFGSLISVLSGTMGFISDSLDGWSKVFLLLSYVSLLITIASVIYIITDNNNVKFKCISICNDFYEEQQNNTNIDKQAYTPLHYYN